MRSYKAARSLKDFLTWPQQTEQLFTFGVGQSRFKLRYNHCSTFSKRARKNQRIDISHSTINGPKINFGEDAEPIFKPRKAAILTKMTRYEYEKTVCEGMTDHEFRDYLESKDSDYYGLLERHKNHYAALEVIRKALLEANIEARVIGRFGLDQSVLDWADVMFTAGGDGTYLLAANKFVNTSKPLIGINTDPDRSEGNLCLPRQNCSAFKFKSALGRLLNGDFGWKWRQRIQVTMSGRHINDDPIELHDQQLIFPEHRFTEHVWEDEQVRSLKNGRGSNGKRFPRRVLPCLALNEVFVGESLSSKVSYYEITTDSTKKQKQKSSGVTICTGTGSSSWHFHINNLTEKAVEDILSIANHVSGSGFPAHDKDVVSKITQTFNNSLRFDPSEPCMAYTIRDPIRNAVFHVERTGGFSKKIVIRSRMWDACLVIDGGMSFKFNDGAVATFEIAENQALRTVTME
ncbi:NAD kinase 2, mitochondrial-like [Plakobranchus ocellatus]|uniref:NAD kinase 2, mitochondrial-like n=1 Tax=Plakobranchus ocellatus TaxID=259542 RepID=A0AAV4AU40_9GAST|nr:NAD kinase 2, mitochondrial-like [Plakobranchus ocellatus]